MGLVLWPITVAADHPSPSRTPATKRRLEIEPTAAAVMSGEEVGVKLLRFVYFVGAGAVCTFAINTYRDLERKKALDAARAAEIAPEAAK